jgi:hypothetical protein
MYAATLTNSITQAQSTNPGTNNQTDASLKAAQTKALTIAITIAVVGTSLGFVITFFILYYRRKSLDAPGKGIFQNYWKEPAPLVRVDDKRDSAWSFGSMGEEMRKVEERVMNVRVEADRTNTISTKTMLVYDPERPEQPPKVRVEKSHKGNMRDESVYGDESMYGDESVYGDETTEEQKQGAVEFEIGNML